MLCSRHHTLVHTQGFRLVLHPDRRLEVWTADGVPVVHLPTLPWGYANELDPARRIGPDTITPPHFRSEIDLAYVVSVMLAQAS